MGTPGFAVPALEALFAAADVCQVVGVVTQPDRPRGRGRRLVHSDVKACAAAHDIPVFQPSQLKSAETYAALKAFDADLFVVAAYGRILPQAVLDIPRAGCVNIHASLLPKWRGASPIAHAIWHGDTQVGVAIMRMEAGLDTGPVYGMRAVPLGAGETLATLTTRLAHLGAEALLTLLPGIAGGTLVPKAQDDTKASFAPLLDKAHGRLDWRLPCADIARQIRAFDPWPSTFTYMVDPARNTGDEPGAPTPPGRRVGIVAGEADALASGAPGAVLQASAKGVLVACGTGGLWLTRVKPEGRAVMAAQAWVAGRGITPDDHFEVSLR